MSNDHKKGSSKGPNASFGKAAQEAVRKYEAWCEAQGKEPKPEVGVDFRVGIKKGNSLSEYIAILRIDD